MKTVIDTLFLRRPKIDYLSPPVCEAVFSGSSSPIIILPDIPHGTGPTGLVLGGRGHAVLSWNAYPGALCYNVYSQVNVDFNLACSDQVVEANTGQFVLVQECYNGTSLTLTAPGCYRISAITPDGETELSPAICTCTCPECSCPDGQTFYPDYNACLCSPQSCPPNHVWDPTVCACVPCGTQHCPPSFFSDPFSNCNCIPIPGGPVMICNDEQTATCPPGTTGDPVTVPAGTFCLQAPNRLPDTIAATKAAANAQALAAAEDELVCSSGSWRICNWPCIRDDISSGFPTCSASGNPEWDGVFDLVTSFAVPGSVIWYFIDQAIDGKACAASDAPDYPGGDWQNLDCFTQLSYNPGPGTWVLSIRCATSCTDQPWLGTMTNNDPDNPAGTYTRDPSVTLGPDQINIVPDGGSCPPDWDNLKWTNPNASAAPGSSATVDPSANPKFQANFSVTADAPDNAIVPAAAALNMGTLRYSGPTVHCNLHLVFSKSGSNSNICGGVTVNVDGFPVINFVPSANASGTYDLPFTIGDTGSGCANVNVTAAAQVPCGGFAPDNVYSVHIAGVFSNV